MSGIAADPDRAAAHPNCLVDSAARVQVFASVDLCLASVAVLVEVEVALRLEARRVARMLP